MAVSASFRANRQAMAMSVIFMRPALDSQGSGTL